MSGTTDEVAEPKDLHDLVGQVYDEATKPEPEVEEETEDALQAEETETETKASDDSSEEEEPEREPIAPPFGWNKEDQEIFNSLPRESQEIISRREKERDTGWNKKADDFAKRERDYKEQLSQLDQFQQIQQQARSNPLAFANQFLQSHNITPQRYMQALQQQAKVDPQVAQLQQQVVGLKGYLEQQQQAQQAQVQHSLEQEVQTFAEATNPDGQALRPHFESVADEMQVLVGQIKGAMPEAPIGQILQEAYDRAVWANPQTRQELQQAQLQDAQRQAAEEQRQRVAKAKKAGASINGAPGSTASNAQKVPTNLEDLVRHNLEILSGG